MVLVSVNVEGNGKVKEKRKENGVHLVTCCLLIICHFPCSLATMLTRDVYDMQQHSAICGHCVMPLTSGPLVMHCPTLPCLLCFCTRLCLTCAVPMHLLLCAVQNPASVPLLTFHTLWALVSVVL